MAERRNRAMHAVLPAQPARAGPLHLGAHVQLDSHPPRTSPSIPSSAAPHHPRRRFDPPPLRLFPDRLHQLSLPLVLPHLPLLLSRHSHRAWLGPRSRPRSLLLLLLKESLFSSFLKSSRFRLLHGDDGAGSFLQSLLHSPPPPVLPPPRCFAGSFFGGSSFQIQVECTFKHPETGSYVTRVQTVQRSFTDDLPLFLNSVRGMETSVVIAKDICTNVCASGAREA